MKPKMTRKMKARTVNFDVAVHDAIESTAQAQFRSFSSLVNQTMHGMLVAGTAPPADIDDDEAKDGDK